MIVDLIENISKYRLINRHIDTAVKFLKETNLDSLIPGKHVVDMDKVFALVSEYETKSTDQLEWEAHHKYMDIQILIAGEEKIGYYRDNQQNITKEYDSEKDILFFDNDGGDFITLGKDSFIMLFPGEGHKPGLISQMKMNVKKLVVKVLYE